MQQSSQRFCPATNLDLIAKLIGVVTATDLILSLRYFPWIESGLNVICDA